MSRKRLIMAIICGCLFLAMSSQVLAAKTQQIELTIGQRQALVHSQQVLMEVPPMIENGRTMVPLRFIGEALGSIVHWEPKNKEITVKQGAEITKLWVGKATAQVNGTKRALDTSPKVVKGRTMVPLRFISEAFGYQVDYQSKTKKITIKNPNTPPQAEFTVSKHFLSIGEQVSYKDLSFDPDGDLIVDRIWQNNESSFQTPGIHVVSLKVKDSRGAWSEWFTQTIEVFAEANIKPVASFYPDNYKVYVDQPIIYTDESYDPDGDEIVEWNWQNKKDSFSQPGLQYVSLEVKDRRGDWSEKYIQVIEVLEKPNLPPVAKFSVPKLQVAQGETVVFTDESYDPDGDGVVEYQWTGKQRAYFVAGTYPVTLKVKDGRGKWSDPYTLEMQVSDQVVMTEMEYNLNYPLPGEVVNLRDIKPLDLPVIKPTSQSFDQTELLISNSPETVRESGILYRDTISGSIRLMYHHKNGSNTKKKVYVLAENPRERSVQVTITKKGFGGPSTDDLAIGKNGLARYLASNINEVLTIAPGQVVALEGSGVSKEIPSEHSVFSMIDLKASGDITFTFVMVDAGSDVFATYNNLRVLERDMHQRGTFSGANRTYRLQATGDQPERFSLADSKSDYHLGGVDAITGEMVINRGNYGLVYYLDIEAGKRMGLLTSPRGGLFMGAAIKPDGTVYGLPNSGFIRDGSQGVLNMVLDQGETTRFIFVPPVSSNMPVMFLFVPY